MTTDTLATPRRTVRLRADRLPFRSLNAAARAGGLTNSAVWRVANGQAQPSALMIGTLLHVTGLPFDDLFEVVPEEER